MAVKAAPLRADPLPAAPGVTWTRVHIVAKVPKVVLERRLGSLPTDPPMLKSVYADPEADWRTVCAAPCDSPMQLGGEYRIAGEGITTSSSFALRGPATELDVDAGTRSVRRAGVYLTVLGFLGAAVGGIFLAVQAVKPSPNGLGASGYASITGLAVGGVVGFVGIGMTVGSGTSVRDETRRELARVAPPSTLHATFRF
jgi:hypothetical protein